MPAASGCAHAPSCTGGCCAAAGGGGPALATPPSRSSAQFKWYSWDGDGGLSGLFLPGGSSSSATSSADPRVSTPRALPKTRFGTLCEYVRQNKFIYTDGEAAVSLRITLFKKLWRQGLFFYYYYLLIYFGRGYRNTEKMAKTQRKHSETVRGKK